MLELTQKGLIKELDQCSQEEDYADLNAWDFTITRTGLQLNTEYKLRPAPRKRATTKRSLKPGATPRRTGTTSPA